MTNLVYDIDRDVDAVVAWAEANGLRPTWIPRDDVFVEGDTIRFREVIPAPGDEDAELPAGVQTSDRLRGGRARGGVRSKPNGRDDAVCSSCGKRPNPASSPPCCGDEYAILVGPWQTKPLISHPSNFGIEVRDDHS